MWWIAPRDPDAQATDNEFLVGNHLLVAPILEKNARKRDVYLPKGRWRDNLNVKNVWKVDEKGKWIKDHPVKLDEIATFTKF